MEKKKSAKKKTFVQRFIPQKNDSKAELIRKIVFIVAAIVVIVCAVLIIREIVITNNDKKLNDDINAHWEQTTDGSEQIEITTEPEKEPEVTTPPEIREEYKEMMEYLGNDDLVGRVIIGDIIDYPVFQTTNNNYYLHHNANGEEVFSGAIFADYYTPVGYNNGVGNQILYGHNLLAGTYFSKLTYYHPGRPNGYGLDYYKKYPTVQFNTLYEDCTYKIFAGAYMNCDDEDGLVYPYHWAHYFDNEYEFMEFTGNVLDRSLFYTDIDLQYGDEILTLSTCYYYPLGEDYNTRFVLFARKVREGESAEVDVSKVTENKDPLMFEAYYRLTGKPEWSGRTWDISLVKNFEKYDIDSTKDTKPRFEADKDEIKELYEAANASRTSEPASTVPVVE